MAVPAYVCVLVIFVLFMYIAVNFLSTPSIHHWSTLVGEYPQ